MRLPLLFPVLFLLSGCDSALDSLLQIDDTRSRAEFAVPLVDSRVGLTQLVGDIDERVTLTVAPDGLLQFNYTDTVPAVTSDQVFDELSALGRAIPYAVTSRNQQIPFPLPDDIRLDALTIRGGKFTYQLPNPYEQPVRIRLEIANTTLGDAPLQVSGMLPAYAGSGDLPTLSSQDTPIDLAGYNFELGNGRVTLTYAIDALDGTPLEVPEGSLIAFTNLTFSYLQGYFGRTPYAGVAERLEIDFFDNYEEGEISFVDPLIRVRIRNGFGVPARAVIDALSVETAAGDTLAVTGQVVEEGFAFDYPRTPGSSAFTTYLIDETNSNLRELLAAKPTALNYRISALINPAADASITGYLLDTSTYSADLTVELPLYGSAADFAVSDSFAINLGESYDEIEAASFRITTDNELPFDLSLTGTFIDSLGNALADLTEGELLVISASPVDNQGNATQVTQRTIDVPLPAERLAAVRQASHLVLRTTFATTDNGTTAVRVTDQQQLRVRVGARLTVNNQ